LPIERTFESDAYRNGYITLERAVRDVQSLEDEIKISIRDNLRNLLESREGLLIQARSVKLAQKRVNSTNLFLEAGRAEIRDLLEAQDSLLSAQNSLTAAIINYRVAELELQRDMGVLEVNEKGLWQEYTPGDE
jgi:outer membrane protein TolC